jgi:hypothetical protein
MMLFVYIMLFSGTHFPLVVRREKGVGLGGRIVDFGQAELVGLVDGLLVDACPADDVDFLVRGAMAECLVERGVGVASGKGGLRAAQHDIAAIGQGSLGKRLEGVPSHDDGMPRGERLETFQVVREPV